MQKPISVVFFGSAAFAVPSLLALLNDKEHFSVLAVVSQPDRPAGRRAELRRSPVAIAAESAGVPLLQFESLKFPEVTKILGGLNADFFIVAAYGLIIPQTILNIPRLAPLNLHGSILPKYRGASPIQEALKNGDTKTGVTLMKMDALVDHGPTYDVADVDISPDETYTTLETKLGGVAAKLLVESLPKIANGKLQPTEQDHTQASFTQLIRKDDGHLDWMRVSAPDAERLLRAYTPWPGIFFWLKKDTEKLRLKILKARVEHAVMNVENFLPGSLFFRNGHLYIVAKEGLLELISVQPEGKTEMTGAAFANGYKRFLSV